MKLAHDLTAAGVRVFPGTAGKQPAVKGWQNPLPPERYQWPSEFFGIPTPPGVMFIDHDTYKAGAVTLEQIDQHLGGGLDWEAAKIQTTQSGGTHYAFRTTVAIRQNANFDKLLGFDTRGESARGYIMSGPTYTAHGHGVFKLAHPEHLVPALPPAAELVLERKVITLQNTELPQDSTQLNKLQAALRFIDPTERDVWFKMGCAIHHEFNDQPQIGFALFDEWSRGEYWEGDAPEGYSAETQDFQFQSMSPENVNGALVTAGSLYRLAGEGGWTPPTRAEAVDAFGNPVEAPVEQYAGMVDRIRESGANEALVPDILQEIREGEWSLDQYATLLMTMRRTLTEAGFDKKAVGVLLNDGSASVLPKTPGSYGKNDTDNAETFLSTVYPDGALVICEGVDYAYDGKSWCSLQKDALKTIVGLAMRASKPSRSAIVACYETVKIYANAPDIRMGKIDSDLVVFNNGVLRLSTGELTTHTKSLHTTVIKPYDYTPHADCPQWLEFLDSTLGGDAELIALLQEWFGYLMTDSYLHHKMMLLLGVARSGKSTIGRMLKKMVGESGFTGGSLQSFSKDPFLNSLEEKPVLFIGDAEKSLHGAVRGVVTERLKTITGGDEVTYERKYLSTKTNTLPTRITAGANSIPQMFDESGALAGRIMIIPFNTSFSGREDLTLGARLDVEVEGIAFWALQGMARLKEQGCFTNPIASQREAEELAEAYSPLKLFIDAVCEFTEDATVHGKELYNAYKLWALDEGHEPTSKHHFTTNFREYTRGIGVVPGTPTIDGVKVRGYQGVGIRTDVEVSTSPFTAPVLKSA